MINGELEKNEMAFMKISLLNMKQITDCWDITKITETTEGKSSKR